MQPTPAVDVGRGGSVRNDKKTEKSLPEISCFPLPSRNAATNRQRKNALLALPTFLSVGVSSSYYLIFCVNTRLHASKSHPLFKISDFLGEINSCFHRIKPCTSQLICRIYPKVRKEKRSSHLVSFHLILSIWPTYLRVVPTGGNRTAFLAVLFLDRAGYRQKNSEWRCSTFTSVPNKHRPCLYLPKGPKYPCYSSGGFHPNNTGIDTAYRYQCPEILGWQAISTKGNILFFSRY